MQKRALILIDFLNDLFQPKGALYVGPQVRKIIPFAVSILDEFRKNKETVVFISDAHQAGDRELSLSPKHALRDSKGAEIIEELTPLPGEYQITKRCYNGVFSTPMADVLKRNYITEVHLLGVCTSICVMETAAGLFYHGFKLVAYKRGLVDVKQTDHADALKRMQKLFQLKLI